MENDKLELLIERKREYIGNKVTYDTILSAVSFFLSSLTASYNYLLGIPGYIYKFGFLSLSVLFMVKAVRDFISNKKNNYSHEDLLKDLYDLDIEHDHHSLIVIKNNDKLLLRFKDGWDCKMFIDYKTQPENNEEYIIEQLSNDLSIGKETIKCRYISKTTHIKYSPKKKKKIAYEHSLYFVEISDFKEMLKDNDFVVNHNHYYWMTIDEMLSDKDIIDRNMEVVNFVRENIK